MSDNSSVTVAYWHFAAFALQPMETLFLGPGDVTSRQPGILRRWSYAVVYPWCSGKYGPGGTLRSLGAEPPAGLRW